EYTHTGKPEDNPVLRCNDRFLKFCSSYYLLRYADIAKGVKKNDATRLKVRDEVVIYIKSLGACKQFDVDACASRMASLKLPNVGHEVSLSSKVAAFLWPDKYIAYDRWAKDGVRNILLSPNLGMDTYAKYWKQILAVQSQP